MVFCSHWDLVWCHVFCVQHLIWSKPASLPWLPPWLWFCQRENWGLAREDRQVIGGHTPTLWQSWGKGPSYFRGGDVSHYSVMFSHEGETPIPEFLWGMATFSRWCVWTQDRTIWMHTEWPTHSSPWPSSSTPSRLHANHLFQPLKNLWRPEGHAKWGLCCPVFPTPKAKSQSWDHKRSLMHDASWEFRNAVKLWMEHVCFHRGGNWQGAAWQELLLLWTCCDGSFSPSVPDALRCILAHMCSFVRGGNRNSG